MAPKRKVAQQLPVVAPAISAPAPEPSKKKTKTVKPTQVGELVSLISNKTGTTVAQSRAFIEALRDITVEELLSNHVVKMPGMGSLKAVPLPAKEERKKVRSARWSLSLPRRPPFVSASLQQRIC